MTCTAVVEIDGERAACGAYAEYKCILEFHGIEVRVSLCLAHEAQAFPLSAQAAVALRNSEVSDR